MNCEDVKRQLDKYLAGALPGAQATRIEQHLESCLTCADLLLPSDAEIDALLAADWYAADPSPDFSSRVISRLKPHPSWLQIFWVIAGWSGYMAVWMVVALYWLFPSMFSVIGSKFSWILRAGHAGYVAIRTLVETAAKFNLSTAGAVFLFAFTALIFLTINRIEKEGLA